MKKNTFQLIHKGKVVKTTTLNLQLPPRSVDENQKQTGFYHVNEKGTELKQVTHKFASVGESIAQIKKNTCAKVTEYGTIKIVQFKSEVASRNEDVWYYKNNTGVFEGTLEDALIAFPDVNFSELNVPAIKYENHPEFGRIPLLAIKPKPVEWTTQNEYDGEKTGKPTTWSKYLDATQTALDIVGLIPGIGEFADLASGVISLARGNYKDAAMSFASMVPLVGSGVGAAKIGLKLKKKVEDTKGVYDFMVRNGDEVKAYVGQSKNVFKRIKKHFGKRGKFAEATKEGAEIIYKMKGSTKFEREIYEQFVILRKYGGQINPDRNPLAKLLNKINPVGGRYRIRDPKDLERFYKKAEEIADKFSLPKNFD